MYTLESRRWDRRKWIATPTIMCGNPEPQCDGSRRRGLWELVRVRGGYTGGAPMMRLVSLHKETPES